MVEEYGAEYIKLDYNQDCGTGTDYLAFCAGEGLEQCAEAYFRWVDEQRKKYPNVLFETCSSGGMRMDYRTLQHFSIVSSSDQTNYLRYPYIVGNILSDVLPEQAAVWSYPVDTWMEDVPFEETREWTEIHISEERVIMNIINSFLGRMHLASHLELLNEKKFALIQEGVAYYNTFSKMKKKATPYLPLGFTKFGESVVVAGLETDEKIYLAVWNLSDDAKEIVIPLNRNAKNAKVAYPKQSKTPYALSKDELIVSFESGKMARFFEIVK